MRTERSSNCRNRPESFDDVYALRGPKITGDHRAMSPSVLQQQPPDSRARIAEQQ